MRLQPDEVEFLARKIVKTLVGARRLAVDNEQRVVADLVAILTEELMLEDKLNEEVREELMRHASEMERSNVTYTEMFKMLKRKMAKEKGIVL